MKIIVAQRHEGNLEGIKKSVAEINAARAEEIIYTSDPVKVMEITQDGKPAMVVSGQIFDSSVTGTELASAVKNTNPEALFYIYSVMPERSHSVDGVIPKECGTLTTGDHSLLARVLTTPLEDITLEGLETAFPEI